MSASDTSRDADAGGIASGGESPERGSVGAVIVALVSAGLASACCLGPAVFGLIGLGGLGSSFTPSLEAYRPYLIVLTVLALGTAFRFAYAKAPAGESCCHPDGCTPRSSARTRSLLWMIAILSVGLLFYPQMVCSLKRLRSVDANAQTAPGVEVVLAIEGMTCDACASHVEKTLRSDPSVTAASVTFSDGLARVRVRAGGSAARDLSARIERDTGYKATPIPPSGKESSR